MSYSIPSWEISTANKKEFRNFMVEMMFKRALALAIAIDRNGLVWRALTPEDIGLKKWRTPKQEPGEPTLWINSTIPPGKLWGFYKVIQLSMNPKVTTLSFARGCTGATIIASHNIEHITSLLPALKKIVEYKNTHSIQTIFGDIDRMVMEAYFTEPIICDQGDIVQVKVTSPEGNRRGDKLMLGGFVIEQIGKTIV